VSTLVIGILLSVGGVAGSVVEVGVWLDEIDAQNEVRSGGSQTVFVAAAT
jgi:hypothetical protein